MRNFVSSYLLGCIYMRWDTLCSEKRAIDVRDEYRLRKLIVKSLSINTFWVMRHTESQSAYVLDFVCCLPSFVRCFGTSEEIIFGWFWLWHFFLNQSFFQNFAIHDENAPLNGEVMESGNGEWAFLGVLFCMLLNFQLFATFLWFKPPASTWCAFIKYQCEHGVQSLHWAAYMVAANRKPIIEFKHKIF